MTYAEKLRDPRWQKRRLDILSARGFECECCFETTKPLHVHHGWYQKDAEPWDYPDHCFHVLCEDCHEARHAEERWLRELIGMMSCEQIDALVRILELVRARGRGPEPLLYELWKILENPSGRAEIEKLYQGFVESKPTPV